MLAFSGAEPRRFVSRKPDTVPRPVVNRCPAVSGLRFLSPDGSNGHPAVTPSPPGAETPASPPQPGGGDRRRSGRGLPHPPPAGPQSTRPGLIARPHASPFPAPRILPPQIHTAPYDRRSASAAALRQVGAAPGEGPAQSMPQAPTTVSAAPGSAALHDTERPLGPGRRCRPERISITRQNAAPKAKQHSRG